MGETSSDVSSIARSTGRAAPVVQEPSRAHVIDEYDSDEVDREALELQEAFFAHRVYVGNPEERKQQWQDPIRRFWRNNVRLSVPHVECRDHLANERTFLAYLRTSAVFSMIGVVLAQLYRLQHSPTPSAVFGYFVLGLPLSTLFQCCAIIVLFLGSVRFYRQQAAMARGKIHAGGLDLYGLIAFVFLLLFAFFCLHVAMDVYHDTHDETDTT